MHLYRLSADETIKLRDEVHNTISPDEYEELVKVRKQYAEEVLKQLLQY